MIVIVHRDVINGDGGGHTNHDYGDKWIGGVKSQWEQSKRKERKGNERSKEKE